MNQTKILKELLISWQTIVPDGEYTINKDGVIVFYKQPYLDNPKLCFHIDSKKRVWLSGIAVPEIRQGEGIGRKIVYVFFKKFYELGITEIGLDGYNSEFWRKVAYEDEITEFWDVDRSTLTGEYNFTRE